MTGWRGFLLLLEEKGDRQGIYMAVCVLSFVDAIYRL
jgi:hypothetical protein